MIQNEFIIPEGIYPEALDETYGRFLFVPIERGYGVTIGNTLRRILLSSIPGASIVAARIDGVLHEFSTIPGVLEDLPEIILNLKKTRIAFRDGEEDRAFLYLKAEGKKKIKAKHLETPPFIKIATPEVHIVTLTKDDARLYIELVATKGRGFIPQEEIPKTGFPEGTIFLDGVFSPVTKINYTVENIRVKAKTDYEKLVLEIWTDGTIRPQEVLKYAAETARKMIDRLFNILSEPYGKPGVRFEERERIRSYLTKSIEFLEPSKRTANCLKEAGIETIAQLAEKQEEEMLAIKNFGDKSLEEIKEKLARFGLHFGMNTKLYLEETNET